MRLGLLGGSFDPVHHGHLLVARALREALALDEVRLVPAGTQPFKAGRHHAGAEDRAAMVALAVRGEPGLACERVELEREGPSYTVDTVRSLRAAIPSAEWTVLIGSDAAVDLPQWKEPEALRALARVVVFHRAGAPPPPAGLEVVAVPQFDLSSTEIRTRIQSGRSIRFMVPESVAEYIAARRLYQQEAGKAC